MSNLSTGCALYCEVGFQANKLRSASFDVKLLQEVANACETVVLMERLMENDGDVFIFHKSKSGTGDFGIDIFGECVKLDNTDPDCYVIRGAVLKTVWGHSFLDCLRKAVEHKERLLSEHG